MTQQTSDNQPTHIDIGGMALPREELVEVLPDIERFEAHLTDAIAVDSHMKNGDGSVPDYVQKWPQERIAAVIATLNEIGSLREQLMQQMGSQGDELSEAQPADRGSDRQSNAPDDSNPGQSGYQH